LRALHDKATVPTTSVGTNELLEIYNGIMDKEHDDFTILITGGGQSSDNKPKQEERQPGEPLGGMRTN
jgi:hypothetical protein